MVIIIIIIAILLILILLFNAGGKELDRRLALQGGIKNMYAPLVDTLLSKPKSILLKNTPSRLVIVGQQDNINYLWQISTADGKKLRIRVTVKQGNQVIEKRDIDFPLSSGWTSEKILATLKEHVTHKEIL